MVFIVVRMLWKDLVCCKIETSDEIVPDYFSLSWTESHKALASHVMFFLKMLTKLFICAHKLIILKLKYNF